MAYKSILSSVKKAANAVKSAKTTATTKLNTGTSTGTSVAKAAAAANSVANSIKNKTATTPNVQKTTPVDNSTFESKYASNIAGLARANNVDTATGAAMLRSNLTTGTGTYKGGGVLDFNTALKDMKAYDSAARSSSQSNKVDIPTTDEYENEQIEDMYAEQNKADIAALKAAIQKNISEQQTVIDTAADQYNPLRNQSEVQRNASLQSLLERAANAGDRGGVGRQAILDTQANADNRLNELNLQQQNLVNQANTNIADIKSTGTLQEQQTKAANAAAKIQALLAQQQQDFDNQLTADKLTYDTTTDEQEQYAKNVTQYYNDYKAEINNVTNDGDTSNDWKIPILAAARAKKQKEIAAATAKQSNSDRTYELQLEKFAWQKANKETSGSNAGSTKINGFTASSALTAVKSGILTEKVIEAMEGFYGEDWMTMQ